MVKHALLIACTSAAVLASAQDSTTYRGTGLLRASAAISPGFLLGRGLGVQQVVYQLEHSNRSTTPLVVGYGVPTRQVDELVAVLREKLTHFELPSPVEAVTLVAEADGVAVRMNGRALSDGAVNQRIKVRNESSGKVLEGIARSAQLVQVNP